MGVGMLRSATDLFSQLELWEEAVTCLKVTDDIEKARALAEERIAVRPESGLLCLLAEMTQDPAHAQRAWDLSGGKYARAQRTLARMAFNRGDKDACISHFRLSLELNPLFEDAWFTMVQRFCTASRLFDRDFYFTGLLISRVSCAGVLLDAERGAERGRRSIQSSRAAEPGKIFTHTS